MNKTAIKNYAIWARVQLIEAAKQRAYEYEITEDGENKTVVDAIGGRLLTQEEKEQRRQLIDQIRQKGYAQVMEEAAYTWFNRFIALRFMEVNGYLPSKVRVFTDETGAFKPEILKQAMSVDLDGLDRSKVLDLLERQDNEDLYKYLLITQCNTLSAGLPYVFEKVDNWTELLFPDNLLRNESVLGRLISDIDADDWTDEVEIIGWMYQYYISEKHEQVVDPLHGKVVNKEDIPAATQLFTTDWVVRYILDNSLGRYWIERHPESGLADKLTYFVMPKDGKLAFVNESIQPEELKVLDPCVGSGHFLTYAFDILLEIYRECGWSDRDAAKSIVENNLYGLDIDDRAAQLACFAVMMKARKYNRRIISADTKLHIMAMQDSTTVSDDLIRFVAKNNSTVKNDLNELRILFNNAKECGSIISVPNMDFEALYVAVNKVLSDYVGDLMEMTLQNDTETLLLPLIRQAEILAGKYDIVATNPPYLNRYSPRLKAYIGERFEAYKGDLFSVFMFRNFGFCKVNGYTGFMTPNVWMFIKSYEDLRKFIIEQKNIITLVQMAKGAFFKEATVDICAFVLSNTYSSLKGQYIRLEDFKGDMSFQQEKTLAAIHSDNCDYLFEAGVDTYQDIPGSPIAYWATHKLLSAFSDFPSISDIGESKAGMTTGDNELFVRTWCEVNRNSIGLNMADHFEAEKSGCKWFPYNKGGGFRKWYGLNDFVVLWENNGFAIKNATKKGRKIASVRSERLYFRESITWATLTSGLFSARYSEPGHLFDDKGSSAFITHEHLPYVLGMMNSKVSEYILAMLNPTISFQSGNIGALPLKLPCDQENTISSLVTDCVGICKADWDSFETSWDFKKHPLI